MCSFLGFRELTEIEKQCDSAFQLNSAVYVNLLHMEPLYSSTYLVHKYQTTRCHNLKRQFKYIFVNVSRVCSEWLIIYSVLLGIPFFVTLNNQIYNTAEMKKVHPYPVSLNASTFHLSAFHTLRHFEKHNTLTRAGTAQAV